MKWFLDAIKYNCSMYMYKGKKKKEVFFSILKNVGTPFLVWGRDRQKKLQIIPNYHFRKDCPNRLWWGQKRRIWGWASWRVPTGWGRMQDTNNHPTTILSGDQWCCDHYSEGRRRWKSRWDWNYNCRFKDEHSYGIKYMFGRRGVHYSRMQREDN